MSALAPVKIDQLAPANSALSPEVEAEDPGTSGIGPVGIGRESRGMLQADQVRDELPTWLGGPNSTQRSALPCPAIHHYRRICPLLVK